MGGHSDADVLAYLEQQRAAEQNLASLTLEDWARARAEAEHAQYVAWVGQVAYVREVCRAYVEHAGATYRPVLSIEPVVRRVPSRQLLAQYAIGGVRPESKQIVQDWLEGLDALRRVQRFRSSGVR